MAATAARRHHRRRTRTLPSTLRPRVAGVDGCRGGWVVALAPLDDLGDIDVVFVDTFAGALALGAATYAVDMPIGLPSTGSRACDVQARRRLGARRSSVFPAPCRSHLDVTTHGPGMTLQTFHLLPKIREIDRWMTPRRQRRVVEAHPELAFAQLLGHPPVANKKTVAGRQERLGATTAAGIDARSLRVKGARPDDVVDACVLVVTAARVAAREAEHLGDGERDARGLRMEIVV